MSMTIMLAGTLAKQPETRTSAKGNSYAVGTIRTSEGDDAMFASITAFGDLAGILAGLERGCPITVVGTGKIGTYEAKDGSGTRASLSITASRIIALTDHQSPPKAPRPKGNNGQRQRTDHQSGPPKPPSGSTTGAATGRVRCSARLVPTRVGVKPVTIG